MVELLQLARRCITLHNHLVKVEGDTTAPEEVGQEEIMNNSACWGAEGRIGHVRGDGEHRVPNDDCDTQIDNQLDWIRADTREEREGNDREQRSNHANTK